MKSESPPIFLALLALLAFLDCFALAVAFRGLSCCCFAPVVCAGCVFFVGLGCVVGVSFSLRMGATKRKGKRFACPLFVGCGLVLCVC